MGTHRSDRGRRRADAAGRHRAPRTSLRTPLLATAVALAVLVGGGGYLLADEQDSSAVAGTMVVPRAADTAAKEAAPVSAAEPSIAPGFEIARASHPLPAGSGSGRRVVFSQDEQRVWLVADDGEVVRTHPVSGSRLDNLFPGTYEVFSRSRHATAYDRSSTMGWFVRFTYGTGGSAIGFHDIPEADGEPVQARGELGTALSAGCIRQARPDAVAVWEFAPVGTTVVVTG
ncbi:L,D-transpeptidase [Nocardioides panacisoli]|uniref:L,D-transpeptidase n=1 Tax=Nocardioides panacisoli TaxID=627624 RepID=UPI001C635EF4|nr:L,D-transpeptidase [Nocardioides panacisoli]QYJ02472.1 L,D-transpeptidase [Nocardioides panacisoli]